MQSPVNRLLTMCSHRAFKQPIGWSRVLEKQTVP